MVVQLEHTPAAPAPVVVPLRGELDIATAETTVQCVIPFARLGSLLILDVSRVTFCDCSGLTALLRVADQARAMGCGVVLSAPTPQLRRLLAVTGLSDHLPVLRAPADAPAPDTTLRSAV